jgi:hypothetical protein
MEIPVSWNIQQNESLGLSSSLICMSLGMSGVSSCFGDVSCHHQQTSFCAAFSATLKHSAGCLQIIPDTLSKIFNM